MSEVKHIATIVEENGKYRYFDRNGIELKDGDIICYEDGRAVPCEYGIYPLEYEEMKEISRVDR